MRSRSADRYPTVVVAPQVGVLLLLVILAHLTFMASPLHMAMAEGRQGHQMALPVTGLQLLLLHIAVGDRPHLDCAIQWAASPQASLLLLLLAGPLLGWVSGCISSTQKTRPQAHANGPPPAGDRQALLQVFRL
jgi:hypothetical protein